MFVSVSVSEKLNTNLLSAILSPTQEEIANSCLIAISPNSRLVTVGLLVVQSNHIHPFDGGFDLIVGIKFHSSMYYSKNGLFQLGLM
jgi:hypothetical protein